MTKVKVRRRSRWNRPERGTDREHGSETEGKDGDEPRAEAGEEGNGEALYFHRWLEDLFSDLF